MRLRLRSLLVAVAVIGSLSGYAVRTWHGPGFAFQRRHARLADEIDGKARFDRDLIRRAGPHLAASHRCPQCAGCAGELPARVDGARRRLARRDAEIRRHRLWAGPVGDRPPGQISLTVNGVRSPCW